MRFFWGGHFEFSKSAILNFFFASSLWKIQPFYMKYHFFLHYGWFLQNLGKEAVRTFMHTTVTGIWNSGISMASFSTFSSIFEFSSGLSKSAVFGCFFLICFRISDLIGFLNWHNLQLKLSSKFSILLEYFLHRFICWFKIIPGWKER